MSPSRPRVAYERVDQMPLGTSINHERVRNGVVDVRGYVTPQSTGQLRRLRVGGDYDGQPIRLYVVDIVTDNSELVGEILHHPDWDS